MGAPPTRLFPLDPPARVTYSENLYMVTMTQQDGREVNDI